MNKTSASNLNIIIHELKYPHICLSGIDAVTFTNIPEMGRKFYKCLAKQQILAGKRGFFNNGDTLCWVDWRLNVSEIKIATCSLPTNTETGWSDPLSFGKDGDVQRICSYMKLKAFW